jgi:uncharacterized membrane protein YjdF
MGFVVAALVATYLVVRLVARVRGIEVDRSGCLFPFAMLSTAATYALVYWWHVISTEGKGDAPGALLLVAFVPALAAFIAWSLVLGRRGDG